MARSCSPKPKKRVRKSSESSFCSSADEGDGGSIKKKKQTKKVDKCGPGSESGEEKTLLGRLRSYLGGLTRQQKAHYILAALTALLILCFLWWLVGSYALNIFFGGSDGHDDRPDYALESQGGSVLFSSDTYCSSSAGLYSIFGIPIWYSCSSPREVIQPDVHPGKCWSMQGGSGYVTIKLSMPIILEAVSIEHIPKKVSPTGNLDTAPRDFTVLGKQKRARDADIKLGSFSYYVGGHALQKFVVKPQKCTLKAKGKNGGEDDEKARENQDICSKDGLKIFRIITLKINSNHGNKDLTCIYRFKVHGYPPLIANEGEDEE